MKILYDTNIFIDAKRCDEETLSAYDLIFEVEHDLFSSTKNKEELNDDVVLLNKKIEDRKITILSVGPEVLRKAMELLLKHADGESLCDSICLAFVVLGILDKVATGDRAMRAAASREGFEPLWLGDLFEFLIESGRMTDSLARDFLARAYPRGLPKFAQVRK